MVLPQKVIVELSDADRRLLKRIAAALEEQLPKTYIGKLDGANLLQEIFPTVGPDGVVRHV